MKKQALLAMELLSGTSGEGNCFSLKLSKLDVKWDSEGSLGGLFYPALYKSSSHPCWRIRNKLSLT